MCGIFGLVRHAEAAHPERATAAFVELGRRAVERGRDSAGFAVTTPDPRSRVTGATYQHVNARETVIDNVHIIKDTVSFDDLWDDDKHLALLAGNRIALGHTRWATQGKRDALTNASPIVVGALVGTHNGDIDTKSVPEKYLLPKPLGSTDTEVLYSALDRHRSHRKKITETLRGVEGRAALAWLDRHKPDRVYLSRAALSPLSIAFDAEGNLYWASNPRWFRDIDTQFDGALGFHDITLVQEGVLLTVSVAQSAPVVEDLRQFTPKCRPSDARLGDGIVWRGFDDTDIAADKAQVRHKVAPRPSTWKTSGWNTPGVTGGATSKTRKTGGGFSGWDMSQPGFAPAPAASASLPDYRDRLDQVATQEFTYADRLDLSGDDVWEDEELELIDEDEALLAANKWVEDGADPTVLGVLRNASMPSEIDSLMEEFDLSSVGAFHKFRDIVQSWDPQIMH